MTLIAPAFTTNVVTDARAHSERWNTFGPRWPKRHALKLLAGIEYECPDGMLSWLADRSDFLLAFLGERGVGKTQCATMIAAECAVYRGWTTAYYTAMELFDQFRGTSVDKTSVMRKMNVRMLVIDELHQRLDTKFEAIILSELIDRRYRNMQSTILCSNLDEDAFRDMVGESIYSRLCETGKIAKFKNRPWR